VKKYYYGSVGIGLGLIAPVTLQKIPVLERIILYFHLQRGEFSKKSGVESLKVPVFQS